MDRDVEQVLARALPRQVTALEDLFAVVREGCARLGLGESIRSRAELVAEELFTNLVKYNPEGRHPIEVTVGRSKPDGDGLALRFTDRGVHPFDPRDAPRVDTDLPVEKRRQGGLGLHLVLHMVDSLDYHHEAGDSTTTVVLRPRREDVDDRRT